MIALAPESRRGRLLGRLVAAGLIAFWAPEVRAQRPCDRQELKNFVGDPLGLTIPRTTEPPLAWRACLESIDPYKVSVLQSYATVRSRTGIVRDPDIVERRLVRGSESPRISPEVLSGWRGALFVPLDGRFESLYYQGLLGALALVVLDRSSGLEQLDVAPVKDLKTSLRGRPDWIKVERILLAFRYISLWNTPRDTGLTLTGLRDLAATVPDEVLATQSARALLERIRREKVSDVYWARIAPPIKELTTLEPKRDLPPLVWQAKVPTGCRSDLCNALKLCNEVNQPDRWNGLRRGYDTLLATLQQRLEKVSEDLPGGIRWEALRLRIEGLERLSRSFASSPAYGIPQTDVEKGVADIASLSARIGALEEPIAYRRALTRLLRGEAAQAKREIERLGEGWKTKPRLAAAYLAASYWEKGRGGIKEVCRATRGLRCATSEVAGALRTVEGILGLELGTLEPGGVDGTS